MTTSSTAAPGLLYGHRRWIRMLVGLTAVVALTLTVSLPVLAQVAVLTNIPLGNGSATITWTGSSGIRPTIPSIRGVAGRFQVRGSGTVPIPHGLGSTGATLPAQIPLAKIKGTLGGSPFTLTINISLSNGLHPAPGTPFGNVTGTFRGMPVTATLIPDPPKYQFRFQGSIGSRKVSGIVQNFSRHRNTTTAHATFTVSDN